MPRLALAEGIGGSLRDAAARRSLRSLWPLLLPAAAALAVTWLELVLPIYATAAAAVGAAIPAGLAAWYGGARATENRSRESSASVEITHLHVQQIRHISLLDGGSALYANWYITLRLREEIERAQRYQQPLSVIALTPAEADNGDAAHDRRQLEGALRSRLRASDLSGALADDRVAIVLPSTGPGKAKQAAERLQAAVSACGYRASTASLTKEMRGHEELLEAAFSESGAPKMRTRKRAA